MVAPAELIVTGPDGSVMRHRLVERAIVGRHPECEIQLTDPMSSRRHCKVERNAQGIIYAEDNGSANGTLLNGELLKTRTLIKNGDTIQIGSTTLVLRVEVAAQRSNAAPAKPSVKFDPTLSVVRLDDNEADNASFDFAQKADAPVISGEEAASSDVAKLKRVTERLKLLVDVGQAMGTSLDPHKLLNTCLDKLFEVFPQCDRGIILLYGPDGSLPTTLTPEKDQGATLDRRKGAITKVKQRTASQDNEIKLSRTVLNRVRKDRQSVLVSDGSGDAAGMSMARFEIKSLMCAPLLIGKDDLGIIQLETKSRTNAFNADDVGVMTAVAGQVAVVIRNSELALEAAATAAQKENLSRFLSPNLVEQVLKGAMSVELGGTLKKGTIFFSDIVSFTKLAAKMNAHDVVTLLNRYFTVMQNIVFRRGGSIDKCAGDAIMAHWGIVGDQPDFTAHAVTASVEMQIALFVFNRDEGRKAEIVLPPHPPGHGIGLNTGEVCAGNIGSDRKIEFTVIGDAVNLSARIEAMAGRGQTIVGEPTWQEARERLFAIRMPDCPAKNVEKPLPIYSVRGIAPPSSDTPHIEDVLFCLPCVLKCEALRIPGMVTSIAPDKAMSRIVMQIERHIPPGTKVELEWTVLEKPSLPSFKGEVDKCWQFVDPPKSSAANTVAAAPKVEESSVRPGTLILHVPELPAEMQEWRPGTLLVTDLKSHEEMVRG